MEHSILNLRGIGKVYGPTIANRDLSFSIERSEIVGLIGANGAGKSTLMRILAGVTAPDEGVLTVGGETLDRNAFSPSAARRLGIRIAHQEFSLCSSLTVLENFFLEEPAAGGPGRLWKSRLERFASDAIEAIFPRSGIKPSMRIEELSIAQRQMVEIARAASDPNLRILILDEPTSSLDAGRSQDLRQWMRLRAKEGVAIIFISHKLAEVAAVADRLLVMRNGELVWNSQARDIPVKRMVELMAGEAAGVLGVERRKRPEPGSKVLARIQPQSGRTKVPLEFTAGEVVGIAGLEGNGQRELVTALYHASQRGGKKIQGVDCLGKAAFVSGDRSRLGIFSLWSTLENVLIGSYADRRTFGVVRAEAERTSAMPWFDRVRLDWKRKDAPVVQLSGGNQQKALMARALMTDAEVLILDDPTRGVDVGVKAEFYRLVSEAAQSGKLVIWYSSETIEFLECDRIIVMSDNRIMQELSGEGIAEDAILAASFQSKAETTRGEEVPGARRGVDWFAYVAPLTTLLVYAMIASLNSQVLTVFGLDLMVSAAAPLLLIALAQMFIIGGSEIDLGAGAFAALINVLSATILVDNLGLGILSIAGALLIYTFFGVMIYLRQIPSLIVTLGASFIWVGIGYAVQPSPAGASPEWLTAAYGSNPFGIPSSVWVVVAASLVAVAINRSRLGVLLRGFGSNPVALARAGWSPVVAFAARFAIAGGFAIVAGLLLTAINTASDINSGGPYTLLSVAAAVIGGCALMGGRIFPIGVVCGALTLSLIGSLLSLWGVSTDFNAAVQGSLLIGILTLRSIRKVARP